MLDTHHWGGGCTAEEIRFQKQLGFRQAAAAQQWTGGHETVIGAIRTPEGALIPARVVLHPAKPRRSYSHVGEVRIPRVWVQDFADDCTGFIFRSEIGEYFSQLQVVEEEESDDGYVSQHARIILMRDRAEADAATAVTLPGERRLTPMPPFLIRHH